MPIDVMPPPGTHTSRLLFLVPVAVFVVVGITLGIGLTRDPSTLPSALLNKPIPEFTLPPIEGWEGTGFSSADLKTPRPKILNVFASWCVPCRTEHPLIARLSQQGIAVYGLNYKDRAADVTAWLSELGDPYTSIGVDRDGRVAIEWGVYGVPETFVINGDGQIVHKKVGPLTPTDVSKTLLPLLRQLEASGNRTNSLGSEAVHARRAQANVEP